MKDFQNTGNTRKNIFSVKQLGVRPFEAFRIVQIVSSLPFFSSPMVYL